MCGMLSPSKADRDYQAEDDHRTLTRAEEIRSDKSRMTGVRKHHAKVSKGLRRMDRSLGKGRR